MKNYLIKRFLLIFPTFIASTFLLFLITRMVPGGPIERSIQNFQEQSTSSSMGGSGLSSHSSTYSRSSSSLSEEQINQLKEFYGFDKPILESYILWISKLLVLDFGDSTRFHMPVTDLIIQKLPVSVYYGIVTFLLMYLVCIPLGIAKALKHRTIFDGSTSLITFVGYAIPSYVLGILCMVYLGAKLEWFPMSGFISEDISEMNKFEIALDIVYHSILPLIAYLAGGFAFLTISMKNLLLEELSKDYVKMAVAKGVSFKQAVINHAIRNSIIPLASGFVNLVTAFLGGNFLIETIFSIDGLGLLSWESLQQRDYPVVIGTLTIYLFFGLIASIISDFIIAIIDPRVNYE